MFIVDPFRKHDYAKSDEKFGKEINKEKR